MLIQTKYHGEVEIDMDKVILFEKGIPGFFEIKEFVILPLSDDHVFNVMQSIEEPALGFIVTNPFQFIKEYDFTLDETVVEELELALEKDVSTYSILTVQEPFEKTTANLQAPIIINNRNKKAKQVILNNDAYQIKYSIFQTKDAKAEGV